MILRKRKLKSGNYGFPIKKIGFKYESRHNHASKRQRSSNGRFINNFSKIDFTSLSCYENS